MRHIMLECQNGRSVSNASTGVPATSSHCSLFWPVKVFFVLFNILNSLIPLLLLFRCTLGHFLSPFCSLILTHRNWLEMLCMKAFFFFVCRKQWVEFFVAPLRYIQCIEQLSIIILGGLEGQCHFFTFLFLTTFFNGAT